MISLYTLVEVYFVMLISFFFSIDNNAWFPLWYNVVEREIKTWFRKLEHAVPRNTMWKRRERIMRL